MAGDAGRAHRGAAGRVNDSRATLAEYALSLKVSDSATEGSHLKHRRFSCRVPQRSLGDTCHQRPLRDIMRSSVRTASILEGEVAIKGPHPRVARNWPARQAMEERKRDDRCPGEPQLQPAPTLVLSKARRVAWV